MNAWGVIVAYLAAASVAGTGVNWDSWRAEQLAKMPADLVLHAPYTPFRNDTNQSVDVSGIPALAKQAAAFGVTTIWVCGSMGQFDSMTVAERKEVNAAWIREGHANGLYIIAHVGTTSLGDARELARHAVSLGTDAIASVPPYYHRAVGEPAVAQFLAAVATAAPQTPLFYYHIPGLTYTDVSMKVLFDVAERVAPTLVGVKYVNADVSDWLATTTAYNATRALMFAPEPKLQSFAIGEGRGTVLAEDFFAATYIRMHRAFLRGDMKAAREEQAWKLRASDVISKYGGAAAERALYKRFCDVDMGPPRPPIAPMDSSQLKDLYSDLEAIDFWKKILPPM